MLVRGRAVLVMEQVLEMVPVRVKALKVRVLRVKAPLEIMQHHQIQLKFLRPM